MNVLSEVREYVVQNFLFGDGERLGDDTSFLEEGIIDSTGIQELIMFLEEAYGLKIEDDELIPKNFDTLQNVANFIERKLSGSKAAEIQDQLA